MLTPEEWSALQISVQVAFCATMVGLVPSICVGYVLARGRFAGKSLLEAVVNLPLVLPPVVTGYLLLLLLGRQGPVGRLLEDWFSVTLVFSWSAAVLAATVVGFPLMVRAIRLSIQSVDPRLEMAARSLGASRWRVLWTVTLPLARRGLVAGWLLAFARSLGEFGATIMVAGNIAGETRTIALAIYSMSDRPGGIEQSWRLVLFSIVLAFVTLIISEILERRKTERESA